MTPLLLTSALNHHHHHHAHVSRSRFPPTPSLAVSIFGSRHHGVHSPTPPPLLSAAASAGRGIGGGHGGGGTTPSAARGGRGAQAASAGWTGRGGQLQGAPQRLLEAGVARTCGEAEALVWATPSSFCSSGTRPTSTPRRSNLEASHPFFYWIA